jgi:glutamate 5-kinase
MTTKLQAADLARRSGAMVVIAKGSDPDVLVKIASGMSIGTIFYPIDSAVEGRKRFILAGRRASGRIYVDNGAIQALQRGGSLLAVGIVKVEGIFDRGDSVQVSAPNGQEIARGLVNYAAPDLDRIRGRQSEEIESILGFAYGDEVIHRNNMVIL